MKKFVRGDIFVEGIDIIIRRDLDKHKALLEKNILDIQSIHGSRNGEIGRKNFYQEQKGKRKWKNDAMDTAIAQMNNNIARFTHQLLGLEKLKEDNTFIVDTLTQQLIDYNNGLSQLSQMRKEELDAIKT